jgi:hypothetical protein
MHNKPNLFFASKDITALIVRIYDVRPNSTVFDFWNLKFGKGNENSQEDLWPYL